MFGKISFIILLLGVLALAIMFDWLGSRELADKGMENISAALQYLAEIGDKFSQFIDTK